MDIVNNIDTRKGNENENEESYAYPVLPAHVMLAHAYVPYQQFKTIYSPEEGLRKGTVFPELTNLYDGYEHENSYDEF